jgi:peptide methionine sulfoxide reductase MsrB
MKNVRRSASKLENHNVVVRRSEVYVRQMNCHVSHILQSGADSLRI